ncbi:Glycolipid 2-alpha-mannosyltransferase 1 [Fulvia fulva]|uniref:Glycolipid 2-alpha-mannosyltransferase 1 n=1 Tax=Passalora fulva TaxID=5499 RepID=A0A9Q8PBC3_PASFU|nr:Glycolipid 2-alpha-mannosyltransferase 1 [Fulvia fulva]KAK4621785.1 Glycolipid 2-alpha-mannosyltransferase 1 [Fulvia fulva]KAK4623171.1 Glycolipid 2-alpha-mannosyltransferase 1 [Fulvia fulva]UJO19305.1 Glycolipid 2-alpha-mannosyltransferase 1 [Fulvia fulva]WPV16553.1 Glycolipid 2-alpha-mannosyltransferase 1 [Fulvia fulva]WPV31209.1 Glycolipid 2-alpha-mannosyltransferase 1 [Fulvia fulva]
MNKKRESLPYINVGTGPTSRMGMPKPIRMLAGATMLLFVFLVYQMMRNPSVMQPPGSHEKTQDMVRDPNLDPTGEPPEPLHRVDGSNYDPDNPNSARINATLLSLVRNSELEQIVGSMQELEATWNHKFNYPWTFFNDEPFTEEFKKATRANTKAECRYELIPKEHWDIPSWINDDLMAESAKILEEKKIQYASMKSYHQMCRWNSGMFYRHPALKDMQYYWRVEPHVNFYCDVDYDVFRYMRDHNKTYGFTINLYEAPDSIPGLWPETLKFLASDDNQKLLAPNNAMSWLTDKERRPEKQANGYSGCHFWSNFEIADLSFWRSPVYEAYFEHLDRAGGFFYERWGDAPVHSIALGLFEDTNKIHWFKDIGYRHIPFFNCPNSPKCKKCQAGKFFDGADFLKKEDCRPNWFKYVGNEWSTSAAS